MSAGEAIQSAATVPNSTRRQLRHTAIGTLNDGTGDLRAAQEFAGHARPETTKIYTWVNRERLISAMDALD